MNEVKKVLLDSMDEIPNKEFVVEIGGELICPKCENMIMPEMEWCYENSICPYCGYKEVE